MIAEPHLRANGIPCARSTPTPKGHPRPVPRCMRPALHTVHTPHPALRDSHRRRQWHSEFLKNRGQVRRVMAAFLSVTALLLLHLLTGCSAEARVGDVGPAPAPAAGGTGRPQTTMASTEDIAIEFPAQQPNALAMQPGTDGSPTLPSFPAVLEPGAVLPPVCISTIVASARPSPQAYLATLFKTSTLHHCPIGQHPGCTRLAIGFSNRSAIEICVLNTVRG